jgi:hypothetical protein
MALNISKEIAALKRMTLADLRRKYAEAFGESTRSRHKQFLVRRIIWRLQANEEGGLSERARQRAKELAVDSDVRLTAPKTSASSSAGPTSVGTIDISMDGRLPMPGAIITRRYKGRTVEVRVLPRGFEYEGEVYRTLSAVAKQITGAHWNGYYFFGLCTKGQGHARTQE